MTNPTSIEISFKGDCLGVFRVAQGQVGTSAWTRLKLAIRAKGIAHTLKGDNVQLAWPDLLTVVRELGSKSNQKALNFRFHPQGKAKEKLSEFATQIKAAKAIRTSLTVTFTEAEIVVRLKEAGFIKRELKPFQLRDLSHLLTLNNGANFSVPGAGKTSVTFALHILTRLSGQHLLVVAPKAAKQAWVDVVDECMGRDAPDSGDEAFTILDGTEEDTLRALSSGATRFIISYDLMIRQQGVITAHIATAPTHMILDESHRMKAGYQSQRGAYLLNIAALPIRRDILSGTPMPQSASDIESQLDFLWPGHGLGLEVLRGKSPRDVLGNLYVRTTKTELGLPKATRNFYEVDMLPGQLALYSMVRNEFLRDYSNNLSHGIVGSELIRARRSVMRLLQLSVNPTLAVNAMLRDHSNVDSAVIDQVMEEGNSAKMLAVADHARELAQQGEKSVIWTIFTDTIYGFSTLLADLNPVYIHGGVPSGDSSDPETREGKIKRFHEDENCHVLIANPAAAGEGISLHTVCHNAIYADRSYVSTHYLQSIDRIHRLGLDVNQETNIHIYRTKAPPVIGSVDFSVSRRLVDKIRNMQILLDDPDLHELALDEEQADDPINYDLQLQDIIDLVAELEGKAVNAPEE